MKKLLIALPLVCLLAGATVLYIPEVANDEHRHTAHQCHKHPDVEHSCSHAAHAATVNAAIDPAPDCFPCGPDGCTCVGDSDACLSFSDRVKNIGNIRFAHILFGE
jgi:hypothetical protein